MSCIHIPVPNHNGFRFLFVQFIGLLRQHIFPFGSNGFISYASQYIFTNTTKTYNQANFRPSLVTQKSCYEN